jgi:hypothetical protein
MAELDSDAQSCIWFHYRFTSSQNRIREFHVRLDRNSLGMVARERPTYPAWTALTHHQCTNCSLRPEDHSRCPVAANLVEVVEYFRDGVSCELTDMEISTEHRTYKKRGPLQDGLSALAGIYMVTSDCPILDKLRPMVQSHLPFATREETTYRAIAMYWLAQFFLKQQGQEPDWSLEGLARIYEDIVTVNRCFRERIAEVQLADAGLNALFRLECYAHFTNRLILRKNLGEIERVFRPYLED